MDFYDLSSTFQWYFVEHLHIHILLLTATFPYARLLSVGIHVFSLIFFFFNFLFSFFSFVYFKMMMKMTMKCYKSFHLAVSAYIGKSKSIFFLVKCSSLSNIYTMEFSLYKKITLRSAGPIKKIAINTQR